MRPHEDHPFHAGFDALVRELEAHPRVHVAAVFRGAPHDPWTIPRWFAKRFGVEPGDDVRSFYATRNGCALVWLDREDPALDPMVHARGDGMPTIARLEAMAVARTLHVIAMPPIDAALGDEGIDYGRAGTSMGGDLVQRKSFIALDHVGGYHTPALTLERRVVSVQVGDDHGTFDDGRPTVPFGWYVDAVLATKGSVSWRAELFGWRASTPELEEARADPVGYLRAHPVSIESLLPPSAAEQRRAAVREAERAAVMPEDPRLQALVVAAESARGVSLEVQKDGRTLVRIERIDGSKQLSFLRADERAAFERALAARRL